MANTTRGTGRCVLVFSLLFHLVLVTSARAAQPVSAAVQVARGYTVYREEYVEKWTTSGSGENTIYTYTVGAIVETTEVDGATSEQGALRDGAGG